MIGLLIEKDPFPTECDMFILKYELYPYQKKNVFHYNLTCAVSNIAWSLCLQIFIVTKREIFT